MSAYAELSRRNVIRVGVAYVVSAWLLIQVAETIFPLFGFDDTPARIVVIVLAIGFVPALVFSWVFELTPEGLKREKDVDRSKSITPATGRKLDRAIIVVLTLGVAYFAFDKFVLSESREASIAEQARQEGRTEALVGSFGDNSIAVLAFDDMSPTKDREYLSDGIAEELLNLLAKIPDLRVISRTSAFSYKSKDYRLSRIAEELDVTYVLEGSVRTSGNQVRVTAQLIEARSDTHIWSETYDRDLNDIFAIQDEISLAVVQKLKITIMGDVVQLQEPAAEAYSKFLQARYFEARGSPEGYDQAVLLYKAALAIDPNYARAWSALANCYATQAIRGFGSWREIFELAKDAAQNALTLDSGNALAHATLGTISVTYDRNLPAAAEHLQRAWSLQPKNLDVINRIARFLGDLGRIQESIPLREYLTKTDPVNAARHHNLGYAYFIVEEWDKSIESFRTALEFSPHAAGAHFLISVALLSKGDAASALEEIQMESLEPARGIGLSMVYYVLGETEKSDLAIQIVTDQYPDWAYNIAHLHAFRNEKDQAFLFLERAIEFDDPGLAEAPYVPMLKNLHQDPRWPVFLVNIGQSPEELNDIEFAVGTP